MISQIYVQVSQLILIVMTTVALSSGWRISAAEQNTMATVSWNG